MTKWIVATGAATVLAGCTINEDTELSPQSDVRLADELDGYSSAGPAVSCV